jgi:hypothetical protein
MKAKIISETTTNRYEFNRAYKHTLERSGKIRCSYCKYHDNENYEGKCYGGYACDNNIKYPNWKLVSKNPKQWMKKPIKIVKTQGRWCSDIYTELIF